MPLVDNPVALDLFRCTILEDSTQRSMMQCDNFILIYLYYLNVYPKLWRCRPAVRPSGRPAGVVKHFNVGYISLNIRGRLLIFGIHIDHMDLYPPDL